MEGVIVSILVGPGALNRPGLIVWYADGYSQTTKYPQFDGFYVCPSYLYYLPDVDADCKYLTETLHLPYADAKVPTQERALIDYLRHLDVFDEEYMFEGLEEYMKHHTDLTCLRSIATEYGISGELESWVQEVLKG